MTSTRHTVRRVVQLAVAGAVLALFAIWVRPRWSTLVRVELTVSWQLVTLASLAWLASFVWLVALWGTSLGWWGTPLSPWRAIRIFFLSNLARYIPGGVWQFAGLAVMASAAGVSPIVATAGVVIQQVSLLLSGIVLSIAFAPELLGPGFDRWHLGSTPPLARAIGVIVVLGAVSLLLPSFLRWLRRRMARVPPRGLYLPEVSFPRLAAYMAATTLGCVGYGIAFWLFVRGVLGPGAASLLVAGSAYVAAYVAGILAIFAPGGLGVREAALVAALTPAIGLERSLVVAVAARVWQIFLEVAGAAVVLTVAGPSRRGGVSGP